MASLQGPLPARDSLAPAELSLRPLLIRLGSANPLAPGLRIRADDAQSGIDPELILYDWRIGRLSIEESAWSLQTNFGTTTSAGQPGSTVTIVSTLQLSIPLVRRSELALLSSFLGDFPARRLVVSSSPQTDAGLQAIPERYWSVPWDAIHRGQIRTGKDLCRQAFFAPLC